MFEFSEVEFAEVTGIQIYYLNYKTFFQAAKNPFKKKWNDLDHYNHKQCNEQKIMK